MPANVEVSEEDMRKFEEGGGLAKDMVATRKTHFNQFLSYIAGNSETSIESMLLTDEGRIAFTNLVGQFFITLRVSQKEGLPLLPKKGYAEKIRSNIKMAFMKTYKVDITDKSKFPLMEKRWRSFVAELVNKNRGQTVHKEEVSPDTMEAIWKLLASAKDIFEARGTKEYRAKLTAEIPLSWQNKINYILQFGMQFILTLYEVRRGRENLDQLRRNDFEIIEDKIYNFKYISLVSVMW